jgi:hypothetical protein
MIMKKLAILCAATAASLIAASAPSSAQSNWVAIGSRDVARNADRDTISGRGDGSFTKIRLCVERRAVHFYDLDVVFANGGKQDVSVRKNIRPGECTRAIDLRGKDRNIRQVVMKYETIRDRGPQAVVTVYGRR